MKTKTDKKITNNIYLLASGARGYNDEASIDKLKHYAIGSGDERALNELLEIAPNLYVENEAVKKRVDGVIQRSPDSASGLHLIALRGFANLLLEDLKDEFNDERALYKVLRFASYEKTKSESMVAELTESLENCRKLNFDTSEKVIARKNLLEKVESEHAKNCRIVEVQNSFKTARSAYLIEAKLSNLADAQVSKAKAHLINEKYCLSSEEKGDYSLLGLSVASKISPSVEKDYYLAQCLAYDSKITESDYLRTLMNIAHEGKPSIEIKREIDLGKTVDDYYKTDLTSDIQKINKALNESSYGGKSNQSEAQTFGIEYEHQTPRPLFLDPNEPIDYPPKDSSNPPQLLDPNEPIDYPTNPHFFNGEFKSYSPSPIFGGDND